jgi:hypothetical protein
MAGIGGAGDVSVPGIRIQTISRGIGEPKNTMPDIAATEPQPQ